MAPFQSHRSAVWTTCSRGRSVNHDFRAWLLGLFGAMAVLLAMTGLYGTMAYSAPHTLGRSVCEWRLVPRRNRPRRDCCATA